MKVLSLPSAYSNESFVVFGAYFAGLFCIIGHIYPLYFGFRGGKGVLTTLGMMLILDWKVALICLGIFIVVVALSRMVSLGVLLRGGLPSHCDGIVPPLCLSQ